jgi:predicted nucleic acid-binding protein
VILVDSSALLAALVPAEGEHDEVRAFIENEPGPFVLSPVVLCEIDYLLLRRHGAVAEAAFLAEVAAGAYDLPTFGQADVGAALTVIRRYRDLELGLSDASIVVLAGRCGTNRVLTLDERHFRALRTPSGEPFVILPADA